ncbi:MAG: TetR/AcrR family transcriptional regulator [Azospirillaceae bacterium]|nr:TetR/AcrR family transcriptional regulator [Azospirillaceae bacterium]
MMAAPENAPDGVIFPSPDAPADLSGAHPKLGRRAEARRAAIMDAALKVFLQKGFERATLGDILALSGGSRATLYELFGGKDGLFLAVLEQATAEITHVIGEVAESSGPPADVLVRFGTSLLDALVQPEVMAMTRILVAEGRLFPDLMGRFFNEGPDESRRKVANYLRRAADQGLLRHEDPEGAAHIFFGMVTAGYSFEGMVDPTRIGDAGQRRRHVELTVRIFLKGLCPG